jgi:hypothetical protein
MHRKSPLPLLGAFAAILMVVWVTAVVVRSAGNEPGTPQSAAAPRATPARPPGQPAKKVSAGKRVRKPVDWVALNPAFADATYVNDKNTCFECHEEEMRSYDHTVHAAALTFASDSEKGGGCETCHGPRSKHNEEGADATDVLAYQELTPAGQSAVCLQCHDSGT